EAASIGARGAARGLLDEPRADAQLLLHLLSGRETLLEIVPPRLEVVHPGDRADQVATELLGDERAGPAVVALRLHRDLVPLLLVLVPVQEGCAQLVVTVAERVHADGDAIAADTLRGEAPPVDLRRDALDDRPAAALVRPVSPP